MIKVHIEESMTSQETKIYIFDEKETGERFFAKPVNLVFETVSIREIIDPTLRINYLYGRNFLSELAEALIQAGYRDKASNSNNEIKRLENHLADLRQAYVALLKHVDKYNS